MFCPKCGNADQSPETYCRQCGTFLPDLSKPRKGPVRPEEHVKVNLMFSAMTVIACFVLAILLYSILAFRSDTHWLIYATAALLIAMGFWHTQTLWRSILLRRHFKKNVQAQEIDGVSPANGKLLNDANFESVVPPSVIDVTTKHLSERRPRSS